MMHYGVWDTREQRIVHLLQTWEQASQAAERLNQEYGAVRYTYRMVDQRSGS